jgi:hypothetical protein
LTKTGEGSIEEFSKELDPEKASFGYVRVKYANDEQSFREKFVLVIFIGKDGTIFVFLFLRRPFRI